MPTFNPEFMRQIIMDHYQYPRNKTKKEDAGYASIHMHSDSCIDDFTIQAKIQDDKIVDLCYDGSGCTISTSSTSIMSELLKGKTITEANEIIHQYFHMIHAEPYEEDVLLEANAFKNTYRQANRIKCATIGWNAIDEIIKKHNQ